jgi:hypothetical protein
MITTIIITTTTIIIEWRVRVVSGECECEWRVAGRRKGSVRYPLASSGDIGMSGIMMR